ncbi:MAG TPA: glycosyltransferase [Rhodothermales bacterium]|nr:glycosyltransferase [Rhodothermales bacterium]
MKGPKVSVIIPNYNHAPFLRRRIESVLEQSYQDFEIIFLDDASDDNSAEIFAAFADDPRIRALFNETNTGIPGKQWNRGVRAARGEYIWIAESDDYADPTFLERLVPQLEAHPTAGLVYCQSCIVNENDEIIGSYDHHAAELGSKRWQEDFFNVGEDECNNYLLYKNTIPNASAVLFRKRIYKEAGYADEWVRYCGDWLLWIKMLMISDLVFVAEPLNYHRRHHLALSHGPRLRTEQGLSPVLENALDTPDLPFEHQLRRWPAKLRYILGRNALRANRPAEARSYLADSMRLHVFPSAVLFWAASFLGRPVYQNLDGIKNRIPPLGRVMSLLSHFWMKSYRMLVQHHRQDKPD